MDWSSVWVEDLTGLMEQWTSVTWYMGGSTTAYGGGGSWTYADPGGEVSTAYARCNFSWTVSYGGYRDMYCDIKYQP